MTEHTITARALQVAARIDLKGLERPDQFSIHPLACRTAGGGTAVLFRPGAAVFFEMNPVEEEELIRGLGERVIEPLAERESETALIVVNPGADDSVSAAGQISLRDLAPQRLLLVAEALAYSVSLAYDERRIATAFDRIEPIASALRKRRLPAGSRADLLSQIGEALRLQQRLAGRVDLADKPEVLWDHPELERLWVKLAEEYDLAPRGRAISQKLEVIRETAATLTDLLATRTSHRLEWYIIALIAFEILISLYDRVVK
jgi:uncharacterized Rmd1/YagE family protein